MAIKRFDGSNWVDIATRKRFDGINWIDVSSIKRYDGSNWIETVEGNRAMLHLVPPHTDNGVSTYSISSDGNRVDFLIYGTYGATQYIGFIVNGSFPAGTTVECFVNEVGSDGYIDFQYLTSYGRECYNYLGRNEVVSFSLSQASTHIIILAGAYGIYNVTGYFQNFKINGVQYKFSN